MLANLLVTWNSPPPIFCHMLIWPSTVAGLTYRLFQGTFSKFIDTSTLLSSIISNAGKNADHALSFFTEHMPSVLSSAIK